MLTSELLPPLCRVRVAAAAATQVSKGSSILVRRAGSLRTPVRHPSLTFLLFSLNLNVSIVTTYSHENPDLANIMLSAYVKHMRTLFF